MSGPKSDRVELERRKQQELERKRQERLKKIQDATDYYLKQQISAKNNSLTMQNKCHIILEKCLGYDPLHSIVDDVNRIKNACSQIEYSFFDSEIPTEPEEIYRQSDSIFNNANMYFAQYKEKLEKIEEKVNELIKEKSENEKLKNISFDDNKDSEFDFAFGDVLLVLNDLKKKSEDKDNNYQQALKIAEDIQFLLNSDSVSKESKRELSAAMSKMYKEILNGSLYSDSLITVCKNLAEQKMLENSAFETEYSQYYAEYIVYVELLNLFNSSIEIYPKEKFCFETINQIKEERAALRKAYTEADEQYYIKSQISNVMKEFGFDMADEICFGSYASGKDYLCENVSDNTAVHIHVSNSKQIMMEVVGIDSEKRSDSGYAEKVTSDNLSSGERERLFKAQGTFCSMHPKIVEELKKIGILLDAVNHREPNKRFSSVIYKPLSIQNAKPAINLINTGYSNRNKRRQKRLLEKEI